MPRSRCDSLHARGSRWVVSVSDPIFDGVPRTHTFSPDFSGSWSRLISPGGSEAHVLKSGSAEERRALADGWWVDYMVIVQPGGAPPVGSAAAEFLSVNAAARGTSGAR